MNEKIKNIIEQRYNLQKEFDNLMLIGYPEVKKESVQYRVMERTFWAGFMLAVKMIVHSLPQEELSDEGMETILQSMLDQVTTRTSQLIEESLKAAAKNAQQTIIKPNS